MPYYETRPREKIEIGTKGIQSFLKKSICEKNRSQVGSALNRPTMNLIMNLNNVKN
jgi:hypothetical protein